MYPKCLAESWDKIGLLVCPNENSAISKIIITNDCTSDVVEFAKRRSAQLIVSYHPLIFQPISTISVKGSWQQRVAIDCIQNNISVYSIHTVLDNIVHGINDFIASHFQISSISPIKKIDFPKSCKKLNASNLSKESLEKINKSSCFYQFDELNTLRSIVIDQTESKDLHLPESTDETEHSDKLCGVGRKIILKESIKLTEAIGIVKHLCGIEFVSVASRHGHSALVSSIAICAGAGSSVFEGVDCDLFITGEMPHHNILALIENGKHVILTNHTNTENPFIANFPNILTDRFKSIGISGLDFECSPLKDPLSVF